MSFLQPGSKIFHLWRTGVALLLAYLVLGFFTSRLSSDPVRDDSPARVIAGGAAPGPGTVIARGALSVHSGRSHDAEGTLGEVAAAARAAGLDWVVLGDHPRDWIDEPGVWDPIRVDGVLLSPGAELLVAHVGRTLTFGLDSLPRLWEDDLASLGAWAFERGGFVSVVHPRSPRWGESWKDSVVTGADAFEAFDVSEMARTRLASGWGPYHLISFTTGLVAGRTDESMVRLWRERSETPALNSYDSVRTRGPVVLTGGLNHHAKVRTPFGLFPGFGPAFRTVVNHLELAEPLPDDPVAAERVLIAALRSGRLHVSLGWPDQVAGFDVHVRRGSDTVALRSGDVAPLGAADALVVDLPAAPANPLSIRLLRDGTEADWVAANPGDRVEWDLRTPGVYRVEVFRGGIDLGSFRLGLTPWIFSNPIELTAPASPS